MKKLSLLIALCMLLSIGGVYAVWSYAGKTTTENHKHMSVNLATATTDSAVGVIEEVVNSLDIKIDDTNGDYKADLVITGMMAFVFKPNAGAPSGVVQNGVDLQWKLEQTDPGIQYNGENIFTIIATDIDLQREKITASNAKTLCSEDLTNYIGGWYVVITAADVLEKIEVTVELPTYEEYLAFRQQFQNSAGKVGITVYQKQAS